MNFTEEQQEVIDARGCNVLVSAAAGSGKTAVLVERIIQLITDRNAVDIDHLLVVTFTRAAAAQMKERITQAIEKKLENDPENVHLQRQETLIHNAQITTIDSFCQYVIRNNFNEIDLDPSYRVADEGEMKLLQRDVMVELLEKEYEMANPDFLFCSEYFSTGNNDKALEDCIMQLYQFSVSMPWPQDWLRHGSSPGVKGDGDPIDICVLTEKTIAHGDILVDARPIGGFRMIDGLQADDKIIAVLKNDTVYGHFTNLEDLPKIVIQRLEHYFLTYKDMPGEERNTEIPHIYGREEALKVIQFAVQDYNKRFENIGLILQ